VGETDTSLLEKMDWWGTEKLSLRCSLWAGASA
jgi:hypothetical protein